MLQCATSEHHPRRDGFLAPDRSHRASQTSKPRKEASVNAVSCRLPSSFFSPLASFMVGNGCVEVAKQLCPSTRTMSDLRMVLTRTLVVWCFISQVFHLVLDSSPRIQKFQSLVHRRCSTFCPYRNLVQNQIIACTFRESPGLFCLS